MTATFCNSPAASAADSEAATPARPVGRRRHPWALPATPGPLPAPPPGSRTYFRCHPLHATISVEQCRANRMRLPLEEAAAIPFDLPPWWVQPLPCTSCTLALHVEAGRVPLYTAEEVYAGHAFLEPAPTWAGSAGHG